MCIPFCLIIHVSTGSSSSFHFSAYWPESIESCFPTWRRPTRSRKSVHSTSRTGSRAGALFTGVPTLSPDFLTAGILICFYHLGCTINKNEDIQCVSLKTSKKRHWACLCNLYHQDQRIADFKHPTINIYTWDGAVMCSSCLAKQRVKI